MPLECQTMAGETVHNKIIYEWSSLLVPKGLQKYRDWN